MQGIRDLTWMLHLQTGKKVRQSEFNGFTMMVLELPHDAAHAQAQYIYRALFFAPGVHQPVLAINLENSILESWIFTVHTAHMHHTIREDRNRMNQTDFIHLAEETAPKYLPRLSAHPREASLKKTIHEITED